MALLAYSGWRHRTVHPAAPVFVAMVLCVSVWLAAYGLEILSTSLAAKEAWETVIIVSLAWIPLLWLVFAIQYTGQEAWLSWRNLALLLLPVVLTTLLTVSNPLHHLVWKAITLDASGPFLATLPQRGPWFWVHSAVTYGYILAGMGLFVVFMRSATIFRRQALLILLSSAIPVVGNILHLAGAVPVPGLDPGAFAFALSAGLIALSLFRYRMLDIVPVAQRAVLDNLRDGVIVLDPYGRIVDLNPAARGMLSLGQGELVGRLADEVLRLPEVVRLCHGVGDGLAEILIASPKAQHWLQISSLPLMREGKRSGGRILIIRDVTREQAAEQLRQDLIRVTVHDLHNPLNVVQAALGVMADSEEGAVEPWLQGYLQLAQTGCRQAIDLINAILEVSRLESGEMPLDRQPVDAARLVTEVSQGVRLLAADGQLTLIAEVPADLPALQADAALLRRVLENLLSNAIKFTPPGGTVTVTAQPDVDGLYFVIADTGPGLGPEMEGRLFRKFCTGTEEKRGSGLGLAFCKLAVEAHGGRIWIESRPGQGTQAHVVIPWYTATESASRVSETR